MVLYIFNPDTDLALANGRGNYTPTEGVRQMISDLSLLPIWYAQPGSYVVTDSMYGNTYLEEMTQFFGLDVRLLLWKALPSRIKQATLSGHSEELVDGSVVDIKMPAEPIEVRPWGWNTSFCNMLIRAGINPQCLPSDAQLTAHRNLSQRGLVQSALLQFQDQPGFCGISHNVTDVVDCEQYYNSLKGQSGVVFKEPWYSSGRGWMWCGEG